MSQTAATAQLASSNGNPLRVRYTAPVFDWENQALVQGNGTTGLMAFGNPGRDRLHFNEKTLWRDGPANGRTYLGGNKATAITPQQLNTYRLALDKAVALPAGDQCRTFQDGGILLSFSIDARHLRSSRPVGERLPADENLPRGEIPPLIRCAGPGGNVFEAVGLTAVESATYVAVVRNPRGDVDQVASAAELTRAQAGRALARLAAIAASEPSRPTKAGVTLSAAV
ncbi:glycoside hydrolase N-terminal domain-containing protein, partial [Micromonospora sp. SL1-18]|uniref:glycoside hydrolase N-terminal domain-containing protein n=1 Tax=Micromonospora sp. SL1-18 TaxID=3399128 RepID=UPI003A4D2B82